MRGRGESGRETESSRDRRVGEREDEEDISKK